MKRTMIMLLTVLCIAGCSDVKADMEKGLALRSAILQAECCDYTVKVTADYGENLYTFVLACTADADGNIAFTVNAPETIAGITGNITADGGNLTFDDTVLYIPMLTDDQIAPVTAPWILLRTLRSGYITSCAEGRITIDDSYADDALTLDITLGRDNLPTCAEVYWKNRRFLTIEVISFVLS